MFICKYIINNKNNPLEGDYLEFFQKRADKYLPQAG